MPETNEDLMALMPTLADVQAVWKRNGLSLSIGDYADEVPVAIALLRLERENAALRDERNALRTACVRARAIAREKHGTASDRMSRMAILLRDALDAAGHQELRG